MDGSTSAAAPKKITSKQRLSAATKISAAFKGYKTRKDLASILGQRETQDGTVEEVGGVEYPKQDALDAYKEKIKTATKSHPNDLTDAIKLPIAKEEKETVTTTEAASRMHALREKIKSSTKQAERKANPEGDKAKKEDAAIKIQQYWKNWQKKKREEEINKRRKGAAITIQAAWRGKVVRDAIMAKDSMKGKGGDGKKSPIGGDSPLPSSRGASPLPSSRGGSPLPPPPDRSGADNSDPRRLPAAITIQKNFRGHLARKKYAKAKSADNAEREAAY